MYDSRPWTFRPDSQRRNWDSRFLTEESVVELVSLVDGETAGPITGITPITGVGRMGEWAISWLI